MPLDQTNGRMVLIAERDKSVRDLQAYFLTKAGFTVEFVDDGQAALTQARLTLPTLIIAEILLPKIDGLTLCRELRDDPTTSAIPVLLFSILAAAARAEEAGASAFLRKPLIGSVFLETIEGVIAPRAHATMEQ
jgi:CheY-like chemotaxis protein